MSPTSSDRHGALDRMSHDEKLNTCNLWSSLFFVHFEWSIYSKDLFTLSCTS